MDRVGVADKDRDPGACGSGQHGIACVVGAVNVPCRDALQFGDGGVGVADGLAVAGELAGDRDVAAMVGCLAGVDGRDRHRGQADDKDHKECGEGLPSADVPAVSAAAGVEEVTVGVGEGWVAAGVGADPGSGFGGGLQQASAVEVGRVAGVAGPLGGGAVQPGADDPVGVGFGEPGVAQQRPRGQQDLVADFHRAGREDEQPFGCECFQDCLYVPHMGWGFAFGQFHPGHAVGGIHAVAAGGGQPGENLPGHALLGGGEMVVGALSAVGDGAFNAAGSFIVGESENVPGAAAPGLVKGMREQRQHPCAGDRPMAGAHLSQQHVSQVVVDARACFFGRLGDGHPQLPLGHSRYQVTVLYRSGQLQVVGTAGLEISAHPQHYQGRGCLIPPVPGGGCRVQRGDERLPLLFIGALGEQLLKLVNHQQQPPRLRPRAVRVSCRAAWLRQGGLPRGEREPGRIGLKPPPYPSRIGPRQPRHPYGQLF